MHPTMIRFISTFFSLASSSSSSSNVPFKTIDHGWNSGIKKPLKAVFTTQADFETFWMEHTSNRFPPGPIPEIDFDSQMVAAIFWGTQSTGGYNLNVTSVERTDSAEDEVTINYELSCPGGGIATQALTQPFQIIEYASTSSVAFNPTVNQPPISFYIDYIDGISEHELDEIKEELNDMPGVKAYGSCFSWGSCLVDGQVEATMYSTEEARSILEGIAGEDARVYTHVEVYSSKVCKESSPYGSTSSSRSTTTSSSASASSDSAPVDSDS